MKNFIYQKINSKNFFGFTSIFFVLITIILIIVIVHINITSVDSNKISHERGNYKLISPILDCQAVNSGDESVVNANDVKSTISFLKEKYNLQEMAVYFRDLNDGPWVGVKEQEFFEPASLLKLPLLISFLSYSEDFPDVLDKKVVATEVNQANALTKNIKSSKSLEIGKEYTLEQVAESMILYSDNVAFNILSKKVPSSYVNDVFSSIGVTFSQSSGDLTLSVKDYASFFRVLFNASYLTRKDSEKALDLLARADYKDGLVAGVPKGVVVAHKFGERSFKDSTLGQNVIIGEKQFHDCGIIYYPERPYILCVMTRGFDMREQQKSIKDISTFFYNKINDLHS